MQVTCGIGCEAQPSLRLGDREKGRCCLPTFIPAGHPRRGYRGLVWVRESRGDSVCLLARFRRRQAQFVPLPQPKLLWPNSAPGLRRSRIAAYYPAHGTRYELIFGPKTYLYIGDAEIALNSTYMPKGTVNGNAVLQIAVVDKAGQLP